MSGPFFSVGVTTYQRPRLLDACIRSIVAQSFSDFEVVVGNNDTTQPVGPFDDSRVRVINRPENLGQIGNMNALLDESRGRYFTWLADDDAYDSRFLESVFDAIRRHRHPLCVFTGYQFGESMSAGRGEAESEMIDGGDFVSRFASRELKVLGCYGVWSRRLLVSFGGMLSHADSSLYSDHSLALKASLLPQVAFVSRELVLFRKHETSYSYSGIEVEQLAASQDSFMRAGNATVRQSLEGRQAGLIRFGLLRWCIDDTCGLVVRSGAQAGLLLRIGVKWMVHGMRLLWPDLMVRAAVYTVVRLGRTVARIWMVDRVRA